MNYEGFFRRQLDGLRQEGRYRVFADLERQAGELPARDPPPRRSRPGGGDGLVLQRLPRHGPAPGGARRDARGDRPLRRRAPAAPATSPAPTTTTCCWSGSWPTLHGKEAALLFNSGYMSNWATLSTLAGRIPGCVVLSDSLNHASMIEGIRHSRARCVVWRPQRRRRPAPQARCPRPGRAEADRLRDRLLHGRRHRADRRDLRRWPTSSAR